MERGSRRFPPPHVVLAEGEFGALRKTRLHLHLSGVSASLPRLLGVDDESRGASPKGRFSGLFSETRERVWHRTAASTDAARAGSQPGAGRPHRGPSQLLSPACSSRPCTSLEQRKPGPRGGIQPGAWGRRARPPAAGPGPCLCPVLHSPWGHGAAHPRPPRLRNRGRGECGRSARPRRRLGTGEEGAHDSQTTRAAQAVAQAAGVPRPRPRS